MAMGQAGRDQALRKIANHSGFSNSTGSLRRASGAARNLGWLGSRNDVATLRESARRATYTVYSYDTPIGWAVEDEETGLMECVIPDEKHSTTTSGHQSIVKQAWSGSYHDGTARGRAAWLREHRRGSGDTLPAAVNAGAYSHPAHL